MRTVFTICLSLSCLGLLACVSVANFQTARTLEPGKAEIIVGTSIVQGKRLSVGLDETTPSDRVQYSVSELGARLGILNSVDAGIRFLGNGLGVESKYRLTDPKAMLSMAAGLGYAYSKSGDTVTARNIGVQDFHVGFFTSAHFVDDFIATYLTPKIYQRSLSGHVTKDLLLYYLVLGVKVGKEFGGYLETSYMQALAHEFQMMQYSIGFFMLRGVFD